MMDLTHGLIALMVTFMQLHETNAASINLGVVKHSASCSGIMLCITYQSVTKLTAKEW